jgi:hypothetical protein
MFPSFNNVPKHGATQSIDSFLSPSYGSSQLGSGSENLYSGRITSALSDPGFTGFLGREGVDVNSMSADAINNKIGEYSKFGNKIDGVSSFGFEGLGDFMGSDAFKNGLGAVNLGVGVMGYLDDRETAKMNRELMGQQIANNATTAQNRALDRASLKMAFNPNSGLGK